MSSSEGEDDTVQVPEFEPDPGSVHVYWEKNQKSRENGVLYSHQMNYKWYRQNESKDGSTIR